MEMVLLIKRITTAIMAGIVLVSAAGCSGGDNGTSSKNNTSSVTAEVSSAAVSGSTSSATASDASSKNASSGLNPYELIVSEMEKFKNDTNVTPKDLGIPLISTYSDSSDRNMFARNVWDMQYYEDKIYIASGDMSNNKGPVNLYYYDCKKNKFVLDYKKMPEEQIARFVSLYDMLFIPGADSTGYWNTGNFYYIDKGKWKKNSKLPYAIHCFDVAYFNEQYFFGIGTTGGRYPIVKSKDFSSFSQVKMQKNKKNISTKGNLDTRVYDIFDYKGNLYAVYMYKTKDQKTYYELYVYNTKKDIFEYTKSDISSIIIGNNSYLIIDRKLQALNNMIFVNGKLMFSNDMVSFRTARIGQDNTMIWDVREINQELYVLASTQVGTGQFEVTVYKTFDLFNFETVFWFESNLPARSFEYDGSNFYFGLGTYMNQYMKDTGRILKVEYKIQD